MAGAIHSTKHLKLIADQNQEDPRKLIADQNQEDPSKFYHHFVHKAVIVAIFLVILPLFPSQAPEFINQSLLTRNWELLHLLFVGIAISYGLFSRRNDETEKENSSKFDNAQSIVSRFLQVSSFFEDEVENPSESDETKVQTWSNQYYRNDPVVVVAPQHSNFDEQSAASSRIGEKPLLLPVRSLKSRLSVQSVNESCATSVSLNRSSTSKSGSIRFSSNSNKGRNVELEGLGSPKVEDTMKENLVLPSPIPWRSRSGRMEPKQEVDTPTLSPQYPSFPSVEESEFSKLESRSVKSQTSRSSRPNSMSTSPKLTPSPSLSSPKQLSPSPSFSSESLAKNAEDLMRKKGFYKSSPPPPPPPPPMFQKSISMKPRYSSFNEGASVDKELKRSFTSERRDLKWSSGDKLTGRVDSGIEVKPRGYAENMSTGRSIRTLRAGQNMALFTRGREIAEEGMNGQLEAEEQFMEETPRKSVGYEHMSFRGDKLMGHASVSLVPEPGSTVFAEEEKESFLDKLIVESDEDTETEEEEVGGRVIQKDSGESPTNGESSKPDGPPSGGIGDEGPDVDKKADEFIAKFREQIRLQRIESIKRSARITRNSSS